jgi:hypothetical protein
VSRLLNTQLLPVQPPLRRRELALSKAIIPMHPLDLWLLGLLDDIPNVVWQYASSREREEIGTFDKRDATSAVVEKALSRAQRRGLGPGSRDWIVFKRYLSARTAAAARFVPALERPLIDAASGLEAKLGLVAVPSGEAPSDQDGCPRTASCDAATSPVSAGALLGLARPRRRLESRHPSACGKRSARLRSLRPDQPDAAGGAGAADHAGMLPVRAIIKRLSDDD